MTLRSDLFGFLGIGFFFLDLGSLFAGNLLGLSFLGHFLEAINTTSRIDDLFLASVERVTESADFRVHGFDGGTGFKHGSAGAGNSRFGVIDWMDAFFHKRRLKYRG